MSEETLTGYLAANPDLQRYAHLLRPSMDVLADALADAAGCPPFLVVTNDWHELSPVERRRLASIYRNHRFLVTWGLYRHRSPDARFLARSLA